VIPYEKFVFQKTQSAGGFGFSPLWMPDFLFDFQQSLIEWALHTGRAAILADCGLGKTAMELVWGENVVRHTNGRVLLAAPLGARNRDDDPGSGT